jgi:hypothetical protein
MGKKGLSALSGLSGITIQPGMATKTCGSIGTPVSAYSQGTGTFSVAWTNPTNVQSCNTVTVTSAHLMAAQTTQFLMCTGFDFSTIPGHATLDGVTVTWLIAAPIGWHDASCRIFRSVSTGVIAISNDLGVNQNTSTNAGFVNYSYGGGKGDWGVNSIINTDNWPNRFDTNDWGCGIAWTSTTNKTISIACCTMQVNYRY